jgi:ATP-dependent DNA ligase
MAKTKWVKPQVVVEAGFVEWTRDGVLRHPKFIGIGDPRSHAMSCASWELSGSVD